MEKTTIEFRFLGNTYPAEVEYFEPPTSMPYYKVNISDPVLLKEFGMVHNFKETLRNGFLTLEPALDPQGKYHAYFWSCLMSEIYVLLLNTNIEIAASSDMKIDSTSNTQNDMPSATEIAAESSEDPGKFL